MLTNIKHSHLFIFILKLLLSSCIAKLELGRRQFGPGEWLLDLDKIFELKPELSPSSLAKSLMILTLLSHPRDNITLSPRDNITLPTAHSCCTKSADTCERALYTVKHHAWRREGNLGKRHMLPVPLTETMRITASTPLVLTLYKHSSLGLEIFIPFTLKQPNMVGSYYFHL